MKRTFQTCLITLALFFLSTAVPVAASAATGVNVFPVCNDPAAATTEVCKSVPNKGTPGTNPVISALKIAITIVSVIIGIAAVIVIILSGLTMITSNGDAQAVARARSSLIYALVGLAIAALAETFVTFVLSKL